MITFLLIQRRDIVSFIDLLKYQKYTHEEYLHAVCRLISSSPHTLFITKFIEGVYTAPRRVGWCSRLYELYMIPPGNFRSCPAWLLKDQVIERVNFG